MVVEEDQKKDLKVAPHLKEVHLHPKHFYKMNVQGAMAILNHDTTAAIKYYITKEKIGLEHLTTAWFLELVYKWYIIMSSRVTKHGLSKNNVTEFTDTTTFLEDFMKIIVNIHIVESGYWKPVQTGI
ncbi:hypothetical protein Zmor_011285 [Zophobas morio]|uniref:Uncharacterized protein n=1 Tax=Zophobas morio TaxID=2755281 RepID=A0AA38MKX7_9CUCU|nr:hypothetical protein Zmor_011285 [Zophobas morio]